MLESLEAFRRFKAEDKNTGTYNDERTRLTRLQADKVDLELKVLRGENWPINEVKRFWQSILQTIKSQLLSLASILKIKFPELEQHQIIYIDTFIREMLLNVSQTGIPCSLEHDMAGRDEDSDTSDPDDGEPVG